MRGLFRVNCTALTMSFLGTFGLILLCVVVVKSDVEDEEEKGEYSSGAARESCESCCVAPSSARLRSSLSNLYYISAGAASLTRHTLPNTVQQATSRFEVRASFESSVTL